MKIAPAIAAKKRSLGTAKCVEQEIDTNLAKRVKVLQQYVADQSYVTISPSSFAVLESIQKLVNDFRIVKHTPTPVLSKDVWQCIGQYMDIDTIRQMRLVSTACARYFAQFVRSLRTPSFMYVITTTQVRLLQTIVSVFPEAETLTIDIDRLYNDTNEDKMYLTAGINSLSCLFSQGRPGLLFIVNGSLHHSLPGCYDLHGADIKNSEYLYPVWYRQVNCSVHCCAMVNTNVNNDWCYVAISLRICFLELWENCKYKAIFVFDNDEAFLVPSFVERFPSHLAVYLDQRTSERYMSVEAIRRYFSAIPSQNLHLWTGQLPDFVPRNYKNK